MPRHDPPRLAGCSYVGYYRCFVTLRTWPRRPLFVARRVVEPIRTQLLSIARREQFVILAYCFMPDHLHILLAGDSENADLRRTMMLFKQASAYRFKRDTGESLWDDGYYDRVLRDEEATVDVALYVLGNPVRKGLTTSVAEYPYSGSDVMGVGDFA